MEKNDLDYEIEEAIRQVILSPYGTYTPETDLMVGSIGLLMNAIYGKLFDMRLEYRHAPEFIADNRQRDVEETMEEYAREFNWMKSQLQEKQKMLAECPDQDEETRKAVGMFVSLYTQMIEELEQNSYIKNDGKTLAEKICWYMDRLDKAYDFCSRYIQIHLGDNRSVINSQCKPDQKEDTDGNSV